MRPVLFSVGPLHILASPVFLGLGAALAALYLWRRRSHARLSPDDYWGLMLWLAAGTVAGAFAVAFLLYGGGPAENLAYLRRHAGQLKGGSFYGAFWGGTLLALLFARWRRLSAPRVADLVGTGSMLALAAARLGCLQRGCCYGAPADLPWSVTFTHPLSSVPAALRGVSLHPVQLYEAAGALAAFAASERLLRGRARPGAAFALSACLYGALRFAAELARGGDPGVLAPPLTTTQALAAASAAAALLLWRKWAKT